MKYMQRFFVVLALVFLLPCAVWSATGDITEIWGMLFVPSSVEDAGKTEGTVRVTFVDADFNIAFPDDGVEIPYTCTIFSAQDGQKADELGEGTGKFVPTEDGAGEMVLEFAAQKRPYTVFIHVSVVLPDGKVLEKEKSFDVQE